MSGDPLDLDVRVRALRRDGFQSYLGGSKARMGDMAALTLDGARDIDVVVNTVRAQTFSPDAFTQLGIDPTAKRYVVVKSMNHFRAGFAPLAGKIIYLAAPGAIDVNYPRLPYQRARRPIFPLDPLPAA